MLTASAGAGEIPSAVEAVVRDSDHISILQLCKTVIVAVRHHKAEEHIVSGFFGNPLQSLFIGRSAVVSLIILKKVYSQIAYSEILEVADISLNPLFGSLLGNVNPIELAVEIHLSGYFHCGNTVSAGNRAIGKISRASHPHRVVVHSDLHSLVRDILVPILEAVLPIAIVLCDISVFVYRLGSFDPTVVANHIVTVILQIFGNPIDILHPLILRNSLVVYPAPLVCNPVFRTGAVAGILTVSG